MENPSIYTVFERMWQYILARFNNFVSNEIFENHIKDENPHCVTAEQVGALPLTGGIMEGDINMNYQALNGLLEPTYDDEAATKSYVDTAISNIDTSDKVSKSGDYMTGNLSMGSHKITNLNNPTYSTDAANKAYVDEKANYVNNQFNTLSTNLTSQMNTKLGWVELWKNSSPNSAFTGRSISVSGLSSYFIFAIVTNNGTFFYSTTTTGLQGMLYSTVDTSDGSLKLRMRTVQVSGNSLTISYPYKENLQDKNGYDSDNTTDLIPYGIYGVKTN